MPRSGVYPLNRLWVLYGVVGILFGVLAVRLVTLQVVRASYYEAVATSQRQRGSELLPHRGTIYVSEGQTQDTFPIAVNKKAYIAYAVPRDVKDPRYTADMLAPALFAFRERQTKRTADIVRNTGQGNHPTPTPEGEPAPSPSVSPQQQVDDLRQQLYQKFDQKTDPYEPFLRLYETLDDEFKAFLEEKQLAGIVLEEKQIRFYPEKTLAAHVLGYMGWKDEQQTGYYGVEGFFEKQLAGTFGFFSAEKDSSGKVISVGERQLQAANDGADIVLSIDRVVQSIIEEELKDGVTRYGAERGSITVMNPKTGAVLGMATYPTYDPNYYFAISDPRVQTNPVVSDLFEPGSIVKPVIMAAAIEEGKVAPTSTVIDNGPVKVADRVINTFDGRHFGKQTMTQVLEQSNNIGMVWVGQQMGAELMYDYLRRFGLGEKTGIELEGETQNTLPAPDDWNITTIATASFGQGVALTPLQALNAINVLANQGMLMQPFIVSRLKTADGEEKTTEPTTVRQVVSSSTADKLSAMMVSVIENGVAQLARVPGYYMAGKTGTAQVPDERGKYSPDRKIISFVGYGPVRDPQFSILIKLDNPAGLSFASGTAAPMFRNVASKLLTYYQISPDYDPTQKPPKFTVE
jgi:cell division protein FtsI/penicillin-binding protein 2